VVPRCLPGHVKERGFGLGSSGSTAAYLPGSTWKTGLGDVRGGTTAAAWLCHVKTGFWIGSRGGHAATLPGVTCKKTGLMGSRWNTPCLAGFPREGTGLDGPNVETQPLTCLVNVETGGSDGFHVEHAGYLPGPRGKNGVGMVPRCLPGQTVKNKGLDGPGEHTPLGPWPGPGEDGLDGSRWNTGRLPAWFHVKDGVDGSGGTRAAACRGAT